LNNRESPDVESEFPVNRSRRLSKPDPVDVAGEARPCKAAGTEVTNCETAVCVPVPTAPVVVVVAGGASNGVNVDADAEDPA
jgi:hypothetical protein